MRIAINSLPWVAAMVASGGEKSHLGRHLSRPPPRLDRLLSLGSGPHVFDRLTFAVNPGLRASAGLEEVLDPGVVHERRDRTSNQRSDNRDPGSATRQSDARISRIRDQAFGPLVRIAAGGWRIGSRIGHVTERSRASGVLPDPARGPSCSYIGRLVNHLVLQSIVLRYRTTIWNCTSPTSSTFSRCAQA